MQIPFFQIDAFSKMTFGGNPAAVCLLEKWCDDAELQSIAAENNLSETAFLVQQSAGQYALRWFTPTIEVDLCGHATLAGAFVLFSFVHTDLSSLVFETAGGEVTVEKNGDVLSMDFPARKPVSIEPPADLSRALGREPVAVLQSRDLLAVFESENEIKNMRPDFERLKQIQEGFAVIVCAPGDTVDFVSRFFAPKAGIPEDPVTGSAHCTLIPYWAERIKKKKLHAFQCSQRGGELFCEYKGDRVGIAGHCVLYARGELSL
ncbi:MAG: PhzF family phenazine biosynthesis protein [Deltaproteobacteria bacterium]|nr:PhzF family phenazine biosynthesis protein [Deltaproteobacteria bacterium]